MPWTAVFAGDTQPLEQSIDRVEAKLDQAGQAAQKASRQLDSLEASFKGDKITKTAENMATAIDKVGGVTKLTAAEQTRANKAIQEAIDKYRVLEKEAPASVQKLSRELQEAARSQQSMTTATNTTTTSLGTSLKSYLAMGAAVATIKAVGSAVFEYAGQVDDLSNQLGWSTDAVQKWSRAADLGGSSMETIARSAQEMSNRLLGGDGGAVAALEKLGINYNTLLAMKPEDQFRAVASALVDVDDKQKQTAISGDLFGRSSKEIARILNAELLPRLDSTTTMSADAIAALDRAENAWKDFKTGGVVAIGQLIEKTSAFIGWLDSLNTKVEGVFGGYGFNLERNFANFTDNRFSSAISDAIHGAPGLPTLPTTGVLGAVPSLAAKMPTDAELKLIIKDLDDQAAAALKAGKALKTIDDVRLTDAQYNAYLAHLYAESKAYADLAVMSAAAAQGLDSAARSRAIGMQVAEATLSQNGRVSGLANQVSLAGFVPTSNQNTIATARPGVNWGGIMSSVPSQLVGIFSQGGGGKQIGSGIGSLAGSVGGQALGSMVSMAATAVGSTMGSVLGSAIPVIGTVVGGFLGKALGGLFGPSKNAIATKEANGRIDQSKAGLLEQFGSVSNIAAQGPAGEALAAAWGSRGTQGEAWFNKLAAEFTAQVKQQNDLLAEQTSTQQELVTLEERRTALAESLKPTWEQVEGLAQKYGLHMDGAGQKVQQLGTTASFKALIDDMETLDRAGWDTTGMLEGMADEISGVVQKSIKWGTEIPENMRPYIEKLVESGKLVDENGEKITDLSGLHWGAPVKTEADKVKEAMEAITKSMEPMIKRLDEIVTLLTRGLPAAAATGAQQTQDAWDRNRPTFTVDTGDGGRDGDPSTGYAAGGVVSRPRRAWVGEGGQPEIIGSVDFMASALYHAMARAGAAGMAFAGGGSAVVDARIDLNGHELGRQLITILPEAARRAGVSLPR